MKLRNRVLIILAAMFLASQACSIPVALPSSKTSTPTAKADNRAGAVPIPVTVSAPDGVRVVAKAAFWAPMKDDPDLHTVYIGFVLESTAAVLGFNMDYQIWRADDKDKASETRNKARLWLAIPAQQTGALMTNTGDYPAWMKPDRIEIQLTLGDFYADRQQDLDLLNNPAFPNPYFTANSAEWTANKDSASGLYNIEARGKVMNNLTVEAGVSGLFIFMDASGEAVGMTTTLCSDSKSYGCSGTLAVKVPAQSEGELTAVLPFALDAQPSTVVLYPFVDIYFAGYLKKMQ